LAIIVLGVIHGLREVYTTGIPDMVNFVYEVAIHDTSSRVDDASKSMEASTTKMVGWELIKCELARRLGVNDVAAQSHHFHERQLLVGGM